MRRTVHSEAHLQADGAGCVGGRAGVASRVAGLDEGDVQMP